MPKPQREEGFTQIPNLLLEHLAPLHLKPNDWRVLMFIIETFHLPHHPEDEKEIRKLQRDPRNSAYTCPLCVHISIFGAISPLRCLFQGLSAVILCNPAGLEATQASAERLKNAGATANTTRALLGKAILGKPCPLYYATKSEGEPEMLYNISDER